MRYLHISLSDVVGPIKLEINGGGERHRDIFEFLRFLRRSIADYIKIKNSK